MATGILAAMVINNASQTLLIELTAGLIVLFMSFISSEAAIYCLIFSMLLSPEIVVASMRQRDITLRMDDLLILVISFGWLASNAVHKELGLFVRTPLNKPILYYVLTCVFATMMGTIFGKVNPLAGALFVLKYIEYFLVFFIVMSNIHSTEQIKKYLMALLITAVIVSLYSIYQIPSGVRVSAPFEGRGGEPNTLGGYLVFIIAILGGILLTHKSVRVKAAALISMALASIPIMYTLSRGSWMAIAAMYAGLMIFSKRIIPLTVLIAVVVLSVPIIMPEKVERRFKVTFMDRPVDSPQQVKIGETYLDMSASERILSWMNILRDIKNRPVLGYGVTGYGFIDGQYFRTLIETGLLGFTAFCYLLYKVFFTALRVYQNTEDQLFRGVSLGMMAGLFGLMAHALSVNTFIIVRIMEPFWLVMAIIMGHETIRMRQMGSMTNP